MSTTTPAATSGSVAAARAFSAAGNFKLAAQHLNEVLAADPGNSEACAAWCDMLTTQKKFADLETFARAWIGRDGHSDMAHLYLTGSYAARKDRENAAAALERCRKLFPEMALQHHVMQGIIDANCPKDAASYDAAIAVAEAAGSNEHALSLQSQAAFRRPDFAEAVRLGDQAWQAGCTRTSFASYMAMICFRSFRLAKSRHYARLALRAEPGHAVASELLVLTLLVCFPPFLLAHAGLLLLAGFNCRREFGATVGSSIAILGAGLFAAAFLTPVSILVSPVTVTAVMVNVAFMVLYCAYAPFIGSIAKFAHRGGRTIRLPNY
jgi:tetratricopeptide (TPR) repeat protein